MTTQWWKLPGFNFLKSQQLTASTVCLASSQGCLQLNTLIFYPENTGLQLSVEATENYKAGYRESLRIAFRPIQFLHHCCQEEPEKDWRGPNTCPATKCHPPTLSLYAWAKREGGSVLCGGWGWRDQIRPDACSLAKCPTRLLNPCMPS